MNAVGYDAVTLGNHEFDYGFPQLKANLSYSAADFLVTCVNLVDDEGAPYLRSRRYRSRYGR